MNREITLKNRMLKSALTMLLSICMLATMGVATVFADDTEMQAEEQAEAIPAAEEQAEAVPAEEEQEEPEAEAAVAEELDEPVLLLGAAPGDDSEEEEEPEVVEPVDLAKADVDGIEKKYVYTGKAIKPEALVTATTEDDKMIVLEEGVDYTVRYTDASGKAVTPVNAGTYKVVFKAAGAECVGTVSVSFEIFMPDGWNKVDGTSYYFKNGVKVKSGWVKDAKGWSWLDGKGKAVKSKWVKIRGQWYYLKANGYRADEEWAKDRAGWMWMNANGQITRSKWIKDGGQWYYLKKNGYMAASEWTKDSKGWMWMNASGRITTNKWIKYRGEWYYLKSNGYMAANEWARDSRSSYWMNSNGRIGSNKLGCPYVWGAAGPNAFDCSGFTMYMMRQRGIYLPHNAAGQYYALSSKNIGTNWHNAKSGDLVFYSYGGPGSSHHVGIYVGNGQVMHASSSHGKVVITNINYSNGHIAAICRP